MESWQKNALENIAAALKASGLSQLALARMAKISKGHLNMVLNGREPLSRQMVTTLAAAFGKETDWFYEDHSAGKPTTPTAMAMADVIAAQQKEIEELKQLVSDFERFKAETLRELNALRGNILNEKEARLLELYRASDSQAERSLAIAVLSLDPSEVAEYQRHAREEFEEIQRLEQLLASVRGAGSE